MLPEMKISILFPAAVSSQGSSDSIIPHLVFPQDLVKIDVIGG